MKRVLSTAIPFDTSARSCPLSLYGTSLSEAAADNNADAGAARDSQTTAFEVARRSITSYIMVRIGNPATNARSFANVDLVCARATVPRGGTRTAEYNPYDDNPYDDNPYDDNPYDDNPYDGDRFDDNRFDDNRFDDNRFDDNRFDDNRFDDNANDDNPAVSVVAADNAADSISYSGLLLTFATLAGIFVTL